ncbi:MAG: topoisomerase C-terminal repeat-containing protein, partial [Puniceicoccales bacterium]|nr:topoisomerase C-terminal repeat-containing protein [Puniceicoccales bacterium]
DEKKPGCKKVELDFGNKVDVASLSPFWNDPDAKHELCEAPTNYILRQRSGDTWKETFKVGRLMCQKPITREHAIQLASKGKTELIQGFISKKGRPFDAYLVRQGVRINWEFPPREPRKNADGTAKTARKSKDSTADLANAVPLGAAKLFSGGTLCKTGTAYVVTKPQADGTPRIVFEVKRKVCDVDLPSEEIELLVNEGRTGLIEGMVSKKGSKFSAYLVLSKDKKKAEFEFPPR